MGSIAAKPHGKFQSDIRNSTPDPVGLKLCVISQIEMSYLTLKQAKGGVEYLFHIGQLTMQLRCNDIFSMQM